MHVVTGWDDEVQALTARNRFHPEYGSRVAFAAFSAAAESWCGDRASFLGRNGSLESAAAMEQASLSGRTGAGSIPAGRCGRPSSWRPGSRRRWRASSARLSPGKRRATWSSSATSRGDRCRPGRRRRRGGTISWARSKRRRPSLRWTFSSTDGCCTRPSAAGSGAGRPSTSQAARSASATSCRTSWRSSTPRLRLARDHIILAASRQFREGDVQHWWHPPGGAGIRSRISDDLLWLPYVVAHYLRVTGDSGILNATVPFLDGPILRDDQHEAFFTPTAAAESASLYEHCRRAVARGLTVGPHGLPLIGTGDWNDGMNLVGAGGKGESSWLGWFLVDVLKGMSEMSEALGRADSSARIPRPAGSADRSNREGCLGRRLVHSGDFR